MPEAWNRSEKSGDNHFQESSNNTPYNKYHHVIWVRPCTDDFQVGGKYWKFPRPINKPLFWIIAQCLTSTDNRSTLLYRILADIFSVLFAMTSALRVSLGCVGTYYLNKVYLAIYDCATRPRAFTVQLGKCNKSRVTWCYSKAMCWVPLFKTMKKLSDSTKTHETRVGLHTQKGIGAGVDIRGTQWGGRLGHPFFRDAVGNTFESFVLGFYIVFGLWTTQELHLLSSEASHTFLKINLKLCANVPKAPQKKFNVFSKNNLK